MIKINSVCLLDIGNALNLKESKPVKVVVLKKKLFNHYLCKPLEPIISPCKMDSYALKEFIIHKKYLTPSSDEERVVIRCPIGMPKFSKNDIDKMNKIYTEYSSNPYNSKEDVNFLKSILCKMDYYYNLNKGR